MTKKEFLSKLRRKICKLSHKEINERLGFYNEIIDDKIEEGLSEADAVADVGDVEKIAAQILSDVNTDTSANKRKKSASAWQIALLIIGSPIWLPIFISLFAVIWAVVITLWAVEIPFGIIGLIAKYLWIVCIATSKFAVKLTKICAVGIGKVFGA